MSALRLLFAYRLLSSAYAQCRWTVDDGSGGSVTLDLSGLSGKTLHASDTEDGGHDYAWSVCTNSQSCDGDTVMVAQRPSSGSDDACYILGRWDASIEPTYDASAQTFAFKYDNGATDCGFPARTWAPTMKCQCGTSASLASVKELPGSCYYEVEIGTKYACTGGCPDDDSLDGLSGGWIFIIILVSCIFAYCVGGYVVMALTVNKAGGFKDVGGNIPQKSLWVALPSLVLAGCMVTKEATMNLVNKGKGGGDLDEPIATDETEE